MGCHPLVTEVGAKMTGPGGLEASGENLDEPRESNGDIERESQP